jgi:2-C-methyl-D-erythritol 4-phosphate cytidylyltransferase
MAADGLRTVAAILVAAGSGQRLGSEVPKAFVRVGGRTLLEHAMVPFADHQLIRDVVVVVPAALVDSAASLAPDAVVVAGGRTRQQSVAQGLAAVGADVDLVLVHDVARAFVPAAVIVRVVRALRDGAAAVIPTLPVTDTIKRLDVTGAVVATVDRAELVAV